MNPSPIILIKVDVWPSAVYHIMNDGRKVDIDFQHKENMKDEEAHKLTMYDAYNMRKWSDYINAPYSLLNK